jgi:phosphate starvation-inducible protein PhoH and related proteins
MARKYGDEKEFTDNKYKPFTAKNRKQKDYFNTLDNFRIVFAHGVAGTGKTALAVAHACTQLHLGRIDKIVITRPAVEAAGEKLGYLPGELEDKFSVYLTPVREIMDTILGKSAVEMFIKNGRIEGVPLAYCRGRTFNDAIVILDEAQNTTPEQMKMLLTRTGEGTKVFVNGDNDQTDIRGKTGLEDAIERCQWIPYVKVVQFGLEDIVRSDILSDIVTSYSRK